MNRFGKDESATFLKTVDLIRTARAEIVIGGGAAALSFKAVSGTLDIDVVEIRTAASEITIPCGASEPRDLSSV